MFSSIVSLPAFEVNNVFGAEEDRPTSVEPSLRAPSPSPSPEPPPSPSPEPPQLFNPLRDGGPPCYTRHVIGKYIVYKHATAGAIIPKAPGEHVNQWRRLRQENKEKYDGNLWGMWGSQREWEDAEWCATAQVSNGKLEELMGTARVS